MSIDIGLRHLRTAVAVADSGGYSAAARTLHVAQSSLSRTVLELERRLGVPLFERSTRRVRPTDDGKEFLSIARRLLEDFDSSLSHFAGYLEGTRGSISVAALPSLAATLLPTVLSAFRESRPEVSVIVRDGLSGEVLDLVRSGAVDMAVTVLIDRPAQLLVRRIAVDGFSCVFAPGHRFHALREVRWQDLADESFVGFDVTSSIRAYVDQTVRDEGITLGSSTEARNIGAVAGLTGAGLGVSAVPNLVLPMMSFAGLEHRPLVRPTVEREICLVQHRDRPRSRTADALMEVLVGARQLDLALPPGVCWSGPTSG